jgi:hypothetical protein
VILVETEQGRDIIGVVDGLQVQRHRGEEEVPEEDRIKILTFSANEAVRFPPLNVLPGLRFISSFETSLPVPLLT